MAIIEEVQKLGPKPDPEVEHLEHFKERLEETFFSRLCFKEISYFSTINHS